MSQTILVTGGLGFIGSHMCLALAGIGYDVIIVDNLSNSTLTVLDRLEGLMGKRPIFYCIDVCDEGEVHQVFIQHTIDAVIHFAGLKAVGDSVHDPLTYYYNNVTGTLNILRAMRQASVKTFIFSSSATVYGEPLRVPIPEK